MLSEQKPAKKGRKLSRRHKPIKTESRLMATRKLGQGCRRDEEGGTANGNWSFFWGDENVWELDNGDSFTICEYTKSQ